MGYAITKMPEGFHLHKGVKRVYDQRRQMVESGDGVDWGMAEALAFGTLLSEGQPCLAALSTHMPSQQPQQKEASTALTSEKATQTGVGC